MKTANCLAATISAVMLVSAASTSFAGNPPQTPSLPSGHPAPGHAAAPEPVWYPPTNWTAAAASPMVVKTFTIAGNQGLSAKVAVSAFPGDVGGTFANVNRWRAQIGLPPVEESALATVTQTIAVGGGQGTLVDLSNPGSKTPRLVAVIVAHGAQTWFYKLSGDESVIAQEKTAFVKFVQTVAYPLP